MPKVIYNPKLDENPGSRPIRFSRISPKSSEKAQKKGNLEPVELTGTWILPGINDIASDEWAYLSSLDEVAAKINRGVFRILNPITDISTDSLADFTLPDARDIIANTNDIDWLQMQCQDPRKEIGKWCLERIKLLRNK